MDPMAIGLFGLAALVLLLSLRVPVALALAGVAGIGTLLIDPTGVDLFARLGDLVPADLAMVPLVVALGNIALHAGITTRIYDAAVVWLRPVRGGVAMAAVLGCGGFSAISGSSVACATTMGRICIPEMLRLGYDPRLATASVAVGGTLGSLIPPSVLFILYAIVTGTPVAQLFLAGLLPGLLSLAGMVLVIAWWVREDPDAAPPIAAPTPTQDTASRSDAALAAWPALLIFVIIVGGIYSGTLTPAGAVAVAVLLTIATGFAQRTLTAETVWRAIRDSLIQTALLFAIIGAAALFMGFVAATGMAAAVTGWVADAQMSFAMVMLVVVVIYLMLGLFLDPLAILALTLPFVMPLVQDHGLNPIWFGVVVVKLLEIGLVTPPMGLNVFVVGSVSRTVGIDKVFAGVTRFLAVDLLVLTVLILFPVIALLIPGTMR